ncbi:MULTISPECIES: alpha/beta fold hydrolase [unclassified Mycobacteroides]|uniref:alpha/beta fold hydrolase n=1 Tax=unclassified Mycobacteroides TaxID=2618759 RepID=UPI001396990B|nr:MULTISPECIES: alpha/beta hydrolase [unclassified Mycobacteroides]
MTESPTVTETRYIRFVDLRADQPDLPKWGRAAGAPQPRDTPLVVSVSDRRTPRPSDPTVVFLHNGGSNRLVWNAVIELLPPNIRTVAVDLPGYGESDAPRSGFRRIDYTDILEALLDERVPDDNKVILVGNCMGAAFSWTLTMRRPDRIGALVLVNPLTEQTARRGTWGRLVPLAYRFDLGRLLGPLKLPRFLGWLSLVPQLGIIGMRRSAWRNREISKQWSDSGRLRPILALFHDIRGYSELDQFQRPAVWPWTAMIWGSANWALSPRAGAGLATGLRPERNVVLAGAGHLAMLESPSEIAQVVSEAIQAAQG